MNEELIIDVIPHYNLETIIRGLISLQFLRIVCSAYLKKMESKFECFKTSGTVPST